MPRPGLGFGDGLGAKKGRASGCSPPEARPSALEEETNRGAPERAAAGVPLRESLAVFRWGSLRIVKSQLRPRSLPSFRARGKGNPLPRIAPPRPFRKSKPCRVAGRRSAAHHPLTRRPGGNLTRAPSGRAGRGRIRHRHWRNRSKSAIVDGVFSLTDIGLRGRMPIP